MATRFNLSVTVHSVASNVSASIVRMWNPLDPVGSFFQDFATNLRTWYASFVRTIVTLITNVATPTPQMLETSFFSLALGGTFGLARILIALFAVIIAIIIVVTPSARHGVKIQRVVTSMIMVILFGYLFYPLYSLLFDITKALTKGLIALVTSAGVNEIVDTITKSFDVANAASAISTIFSTGISGVIGIFIVAESLGIWFSATMTMLFYPLAIAVRPLGQFGNRVFNAFNAMIITTLIAPPFMAFTFLWPLFSQKYLPIVLAMGVTPFAALIGSAISVFIPLVIFAFAYKKSTEVFGRMDDVSGKFDVGQMPPVSVDEIKNDVRVTNNSSTTAVIADVVGDNLLYGNGDDKKDFFDDVMKSAVNLAATSATAAGHPYLGMAAKAAGGMYEKMRSSQQEPEGGNPNDGQ